MEINCKKEIARYIKRRPEIEDSKYISMWVPHSWRDMEFAFAGDNLQSVIAKTKAGLVSQQWLVCETKTGKVVKQRYKTCESCFFCGKVS